MWFEEMIVKERHTKTTIIIYSVHLIFINFIEIIIKKINMVNIFLKYFFYKILKGIIYYCID